MYLATKIIHCFDRLTKFQKNTQKNVPRKEAHLLRLFAILDNFYFSASDAFNDGNPAKFVRFSTILNATEFVVKLFALLARLTVTENV